MAEIDDSDKKYWQQAVENVTPLVKSARVIATPTKKINRPTPPIETELKSTWHFHDNDEPQPEAIFFARSGLQYRLQQQFRSGKLRPQRNLDLHGLIVDEARAAVTQFLMHSTTEKIRVVKIIHGKGMATGAKLRNKVYQWLPQCQDVLAFSSALARDGGTGAVYVLLRVNS